MTGKGPLNYTTEIEPEKSAFECLALLGRYGASRIGLAHRKDKVPMGLTFTIMTKWGDRQYEVLVDSAGTLKVLQRYAKEGVIRSVQATPRQADRVAWRTVKLWLETQLSLIETGLMDAERVFAPSMLVAPGTTIMDAYDQQMAIESGG
jgi:hypothetical protein